MRFVFRLVGISLPLLIISIFWPSLSNLSAPASGKALADLVSQQPSIRITITSPQSGSMVSGIVPILGSTSHPQFLQYQVQYAPEPNPQNVWYSTGILSRFPVTDGWLGAWNTASLPNGIYNLRLSVSVSNGNALATLTSNIRVQNQAPLTPTPTPEIGRPVAAFTPNITLGNAPLTVQFTNQSYGNITGYEWNFGDNFTSTDPNPSHTYNGAGIYAVTLTAGGPGGQDSRTAYIQVLQPSPMTPTPSIIRPVAAFTPSATRGNAPLTVQFSNQSYGNITSFQWDIGDGFTSTEPNPTHTYNTAGIYLVSLVVTGPGGQDIQQALIQATQALIPTVSVLPTVPPNTVTPSPQEVIFQVNRAEDDVNQTADSFVSSSNSLWIGNAGTTDPTNFAAVRFNHVTIPQGARILSARVEFYNLAFQWIAVGINVYADVAGNSLAFSRDNPPSRRQATSQSLQFHSDEQSPEKTWISYGDLSAIIQEVITRPDWTSGNSLSIIMQGASEGRWGRKFFNSFDGDPSLAPRLVVTYQAS
jgi:PKD repeat protein